MRGELERFFFSNFVHKKKSVRSLLVPLIFEIDFKVVVLYRIAQSVDLIVTTVVFIYVQNFSFRPALFRLASPKRHNSIDLSSIGILSKPVLTSSIQLMPIK